MTTRCEYCGQLYDGLSCPHCGAPRGDDKCAIYADGIIYWTSDGVVQSEETDHVGMSESDGVVQSEETDHVGMSESDGVVQSEETDHVGMSESDGVVQSEETDHVGMSERKRARKIARKTILSMLASIGFTLALILLLVAFLFLVLVLIKSC